MNPRGDVKPCCGFASDLDQLTIGNIHHDSVADIVERARRQGHLKDARITSRVVRLCRRASGETHGDQGPVVVS